MTEPDAWRFRKKDCSYCQNGSYEVQQEYPEQVDFEKRDKIHGTQHPKDSLEDVEPLYSESTIKQLLQDKKKELEDKKKTYYKEKNHCVNPQAVNEIRNFIEDLQELLDEYEED